LTILPNGTHQTPTGAELEVDDDDDEDDDSIMCCECTNNNASVMCTDQSVATFIKSERKASCKPASLSVFLSVAVAFCHIDLGHLYVNASLLVW